jgi:hypothetical protein
MEVAGPEMAVAQRSLTVVVPSGLRATLAMGMVRVPPLMYSPAARYRVSPSSLSAAPTWLPDTWNPSARTIWP